MEELADRLLHCCKRSSVPSCTVDTLREHLLDVTYFSVAVRVQLSRREVVIVVKNLLVARSGLTFTVCPLHSSLSGKAMLSGECVQEQLSEEREKMSDQPSSSSAMQIPGVVLAMPCTDTAGKVAGAILAGWHSPAEESARKELQLRLASLAGCMSPKFRASTAPLAQSLVLVLHPLRLGPKHIPESCSSSSDLGHPGPGPAGDSSIAITPSSASSLSSSQESSGHQLQADGIEVASPAKQKTGPGGTVPAFTLLGGFVDRRLEHDFALYYARQALLDSVIMNIVQVVFLLAIWMAHPQLFDGDTWAMNWKSVGLVQLAGAVLGGCCSDGRYLRLRDCHKALEVLYSSAYAFGILYPQMIRQMQHMHGFINVYLWVGTAGLIWLPITALSFRMRACWFYPLRIALLAMAMRLVPDLCQITPGFLSAGCKVWLPLLQCLIGAVMPARVLFREEKLLRQRFAAAQCAD